MRAPLFRNALRQNDDILRRYQTPGTVAKTTYGILPPVIDVPAVATPARFPVATAINPPIMQPAPTNGGNAVAAPGGNSNQRWQAPSTDRYQARQQARGVSRRSDAYPLARQFLRIDGSAPQSERDTLGVSAPVDFAGRMIGNRRSFGFEATAADTARDITTGAKSTDDPMTGGFGWKKPLTYGELAKKYSFSDMPYRVTGNGEVDGI